jgi:hypothetical protein
VARVSQVIVLVEDERQQRLIRRLLRLLRYRDHDLRFEPIPNGQGSGEAWVRERYSGAVATYRERAARAETSLVVVIDADTEDARHRTRQLADRLVGEGLPPCANEERIVHLVPKRNIETWILNLNGQPVDEERDFRHAHGVDDLIDSAAQVLFEWTRPNAEIPQHCVPSLQAAIPEIRRLEYRT